MKGMRLFYGSLRKCYPRSRTVPPNYDTGEHTGAVVENVNFTGVKNMSEEQRHYCCRWCGEKSRRNHSEEDVVILPIFSARYISGFATCSDNPLTPHSIDNFPPQRSWGIKVRSRLILATGSVRVNSPDSISAFNSKAASRDREYWPKEPP
jgi:hypothetical protein